MIFKRREKENQWSFTPWVFVLFGVSFCSMFVVEAIAKGDESIKTHAAYIQKRTIYKTIYKKQTVYYHTSICCDIPSLLVDANGKFICYPNGGFVSVDKRCADFIFDESKSVKIEGMPDYAKNGEAK